MNQIYEQIEKDLKFNRNHGLTMNLRKEMSSSDLKNHKDLIQNEILLLDFNLIEGKALPINESIRPDGNGVQEYPSLIFFDNERLKYVQKRSISTNNPLLRGRYNQILWNSKLKHHDFAKKSVDAYLEYLENLSWSNKEDFQQSEFIEILENSYCLAIQSKYRLNEHDFILGRLLNSNETYMIRGKLKLLHFMLNQKYFKRNRFTDAGTICEQAFEQALVKPDFYFAEYIKQIAVKVSPKIELQQSLWYSKLGQVYEAFAEMRKIDDETGMIPLKMYQSAMNNYKIAGNKEALEIVSKKFADQKDELKLSRVELPVKDELLEALDEFNMKRAEKLSEQSSKVIFDYLVFSKDLFPSNEMIKENDPNSWAWNLLYTKIEFDINKNISKRSRLEDNLLNEESFEKYNLLMNVNTLPYLHYIFIEGIKSGNLNFESLLNYIMENTWIGTKLEEVNSAGEVRGYNWLSMLIPSLYHFFNQLEFVVKSNGFYLPNFVLSVDSLSLKFEGLLRDMAKRIGINTIKTVREDTREMFTEDILRDGKDELSKFYDDTDFLLFNFVYTKQGINLRNDIAHCYFKHLQSYDINLMYLLIVSILRLGKRSIEYDREKASR